MNIFSDSINSLIHDAIMHPNPATCLLLMYLVPMVIVGMALYCVIKLLRQRREELKAVRDFLGHNHRNFRKRDNKPVMHDTEKYTETSN